MRIKKTIRIKVLVRGVVDCEQEFLDKFRKDGILGSQELDYNLTKEQYESPYFAKCLMDYRKNLLESLIYTQIEEVEEPEVET